MSKNNLILKIEAGKKYSGFKKNKSTLAFYDDRVTMTYNNRDKDTIKISDILDMYIVEKVLNNIDEKYLMVIYENAEGGIENLTPTFNEELLDKVDSLIKNNSNYTKFDRKYPETIKWFLPCRAIERIQTKNNYNAFGFVKENKEDVDVWKKVLEDWWGIESVEELIEAIEELKKGQMTRQFINW